MPDYILERRVWLPRSRSEVFDFFADPRNLTHVNPPRTRLRWRSAPPARLSAGAVLDFTMRAGGLSWRWRVIVREFDPPYRFVDAQLWGPFSRWEHRHRFMEGPAIPGTPPEIGVPLGTWVEDRVTYRPPLGPLGQLAHGLGVGRQITALFDYRDHRLRELLGAP